ncbi:MAG: LytTR family DNA-binding domain-containing protein [Dysgonamonadaceae bacterium]|jgi:DNA-binding LytR/AlgR family response regulator|nr:LytTR family DNA-binding domain-containing protein [Dysgonamonadaceae bacterium]
MKCIAIDDEPPALKLLAHYCSRVPSIQLLGACTDPLEGISYIRSMQPDLVFLDVRMPDISGIHIAQILEKDTLVIFTTAHREYAVDGFELDVVDYLLKPFDFERFLKAYNKAEERFLSSKKKTGTGQAADDKTIAFKYNYRNVQLPLHSILYIEAFDNYIKIVTPDKMYMPVMTMKTIQEFLPEPEFLRVHKSFIVSVGKIKSFNNAQVVTERKKIPVGRHYRRDFLEKIEGLKRNN